MHPNLDFPTPGIPAMECTPQSVRFSGEATPKEDPSHEGPAGSHPSHPHGKPTATTTTEPDPTEKDPAEAYDYAELVQLAASPCEADQAKLRKILDADSRLFKLLGDLHHRAEQAIARLAANKCPLMTAATNHHAETLRVSLLSEDSSEWEKLCVAHAVLALQTCEALHGYAFSDHRISTDRCWQKALDAAERRFQASLKTVELARRIARDATDRPLRLVRGGERRAG